MSECCLYHICRKQDKGDLTKGYVGISKEPETRWLSHIRGETNKHLKHAYTKYADIIEYVVTTSSYTVCMWLEYLWRPNKKMGWNLAIGGGLPPSAQGIKRSASFCKHISERQQGALNHAYGKPAHNKGAISVDYASIICRRDTFKEQCKKQGVSFTDFEECFAEWRVKPSGIRYRTYTHHKKEIINE